MLKRIVHQIAGFFGYHIGILPPAPDRLANHLIALLDHFGINIVLDVGAHYGEFGTLLRASGYRGRIVSWEPVKESFTSLQNAAHHDPQWTVYNYALGRTEGQHTINITRGTVCASFLKPSGYGTDQFRGKLDIKGTEIVDVRRLDSVFPECISGIHDPRVFLKLDTQGYDMQVLDGGAKSMEDVLILQTELSILPIYENMSAYSESISKITRLGFAISGFFPVTIDNQFRLVEMDCVMVRSSDHEPVVRSS